MKHCLVVDDSDVVRKVAKRILEEANITSTEAESGAAALDLCRGAMPDLILLDWHMPGGSGVEFMTALRSAPDGEFPRIIYCTTESEPDQDHRAMAAGADVILMKPFDQRSVTIALKAVGAFHDAGADDFHAD